MLCPFCQREFNKNICECGAYKITPETQHLSLKEQPYYGERDDIRETN